MRDLPLTSLRALAAVYETGGIRPAGRLLGVAHSAVSRHLKELQELVETPLFEPGGGRSAPVFTAQGEALGREALAAFKGLDACLTSIREAHRPHSLTVATTSSFAMRWLLPRLPDFQTAYPRAEVSVIVDQRRLSPLEEGADVSIRMGGKPGGRHTFPLMDDTLFPVASPKLVGQAPGSLAGLKDWPLLHDRDPNALWSLWRRKVGPGDLDIRKGARFTSSDLVLRAAEQGLGVALARGRLAMDGLESGSLVRLFPNQEVLLPDAYWITVNETRSHRHVVGQFIDWLKIVSGNPQNRC